MHKDAFDHIIRQKLAALALPFQPHDWNMMQSMLDEAFDDNIRSLLKSYSLPFSAEDWQKFEAKLDQVFDEHVRTILLQLKDEGEPGFWPVVQALLDGQPVEAQLLRRLLTLQVAFDPADWQEMASRLDGDSFITHLRSRLEDVAMQPERIDWPFMVKRLNIDFDDQVRAKLESASDDLFEEPASDWMAFEQMLPFGAFDQQVRDKLDSHSLEPAIGDWYDMASRLDAPVDAHIRETLTSLEFQPEKGDWKKMAALLGEPTRKPVAFPWRRFSVAAAIVMLLLIGGGWLSQGPSEKLVGRWLNKFKTNTQTLAEAGQNERIVAPPASQAIDATPVAGNREEIEGEEAAERWVGKLEVLAVSSSSVLADNLSEQVAVAIAQPQDLVAAEAQPTPPESSKRKLFDVKPLLFSRTETFALGAPHLSKSLSMSALLPPDRKPAEIRLGFTGSITNTKAELNGSNAGAGFLTGLRAEMKINSRWHLISGLTYGEKRFSHTSFVTVDQRTFRTALDGNMQVIELPLLMRYHFPSSDEKFSLYVQGGIVTLLSIQESYQHFTPESSSNGLAIRATPRLLEPTERAWSLNTYPGNIQVALGLEYTLNDRIAFQLEPFFTQSLQRTKGSGSLGLEKKLYTTGLTFNTIFDLSVEK